MGITIRYQGSLDRTEDLPKLVNELTDIAQAMRWNTQRIIRDSENTEFAGIFLMPGGDCESQDRANRRR